MIDIRIRFNKIALLAIVIISMAGISARAQSTITLNGIVRDSLTHEPIPYAAVFLKGSDRGGLTDEDGRFKIVTAKNFTAIEVSSMGYESKTVFPKKNGKYDLSIDLMPIGVKLKEVVVKPKKEKYSKKNNPAVDFVTRIRNAKHLTDPKNNAYYNYDKYERITIALNNFSPTSNKNLILKKFNFLKEHIDTSEVSGRPILNLSTREKASQIHYRRNPESEKEVILGVRQAGLDDFLDQENMRTLYEDFFSDIDLYQNNVDLLHNKFVSPLSGLAPDFYRFYLTDTVMVGNESCIELSFVPRNSQSFGFTGKVYVPAGDTTMFIRKVVMNVPKEINLNFIEKLYIEQEFERAPNGARLLVKDDLTAEISLMPGTQGLYFRRNSGYANHNFAPPVNEDMFRELGSTIMHPDAEVRNGDFWNQKRIVAISRREENVGGLASLLRKVPLYYWGEKFLKIMVNGYVTTGKDSKFDIGPVNTVISSNHLEGVRLRLGGMTTANLNNRLFARGYAAYGTKDKVWKYQGELEYSFTDKKYHSREFPIHSLRLTHLYDVDMLGQHFAFANQDNMFLSLKRHTDYQITYHRVSRLDYTLELRNNFSVVATIKHERQEATPWMTFITGYGRKFGHYDVTSFAVQLRYAPGEKFYQAKTQRVSINAEVPVFTLTHTYAPKGFMNSMFEINRTELSVQKRFWFSAFGYLDMILKGGHLWSKSAYPDLLIPNANLSYTIQPETFALMEPMEFMNDSYVSWDMAYWANGAIFNYIPYFKKLKLREVFSFRGIWGHLSKKNNPDFDYDLFSFPKINNTIAMGHTPYMEIGVGIDNIFKIMRLDYVWRLTYRDRPGIDKSGLRLALHFTF